MAALGECGRQLSKHQWLVNEQAIAAIAPSDADNDDSSLESNELEQVYEIFRFYDSSLHGDRLPSINLPRFLEILKDGHILSTSFTVQQAEEVFATAVLGKLRTYLDADGTPALSFKLFCGALMQCATIKAFTPLNLQPQFPNMVPSSALRKLARRHLFCLMSELLSATNGPGRPNNTSHLAGSKSMAVAVGDSYWHPLDAQFETRLQKRRVSQFAYDNVVRHIMPAPHAPANSAVTPEMRSCFDEQHLDMIVDRFHLFDHAETGTIDHDELFVFFHGLADALDLGNVHPLVAQLKSVENVTLPSILRVLLGSTKPDDSPCPANDVATTTAPLNAVVVDAIETQEKLLALSHDCPPDDWGIDEIAHAPEGPATNSVHNTVIKRVTITNNTQAKKPKKPRAATPPRVTMVHNGVNENSVKKFWEATVRDHGLAETSGLFQKGEKRVLAETHTRLKSEDSATSLLQLRVRSRLSEGFVVVEGKKFVADVLAADRAIKEKKAASAKQKAQTWTPKKMSLDKGSTVVRSTPNLPLYSPANHQPLYHQPAYSLPPYWRDHAAMQKDSSWVHEPFPRAPVGSQHGVDTHRRPAHPTIRANAYYTDMTRLGLLPRIPDRRQNTE